MHGQELVSAISTSTCGSPRTFIESSIPVVMGVTRSRVSYAAKPRISRSRRGWRQGLLSGLWDTHSVRYPTVGPHRRSLYVNSDINCFRFEEAARRIAIGYTWKDEQTGQWRKFYCRRNAGDRAPVSAPREYSALGQEYALLCYLQQVPIPSNWPEFIPKHFGLATVFSYELDLATQRDA